MIIDGNRLQAASLIATIAKANILLDQSAFDELSVRVSVRNWLPRE